MRFNEAVFLILLGSLFLRLSFASTQPILEIIFFGGYFLFSLWLYLTEENVEKKRIKSILPIVSVPLIYFSLSHVMKILDPPNQDHLLQKADELLVGGNLSLPLQSIAHPVLTECMYIAYLWFFAYVICSLIQQFRRGEMIRQSFYTGLFTIYWIGFLGYSWVPALGPYLMNHLGGPVLDGLYLTRPIYELILCSNNQVDVFPSLHCSISAFCLFFDWNYNRSRFWLYLPLCVLIWISTIYLGYHYFIDIVVGFGLTFLALKLSKRDFLKTSCGF